jgi:hypothetical protein
MLEGHYDSYQNFIYVVNQGIVTWGRQLIGVLFFWVPRALWPAKPVGSGHFIASEYNLSFSNISMNLFGEGYINFGMLGILLFVFIVAYITKYLDQMYWIHRMSGFGKRYYPFLLGLFFFMLRGDLMSSFAYTLGTVFAVIFVSLIGSRKSI